MAGPPTGYTPAGGRQEGGMSGEAIYRGYDRAALDAQYNNRARIPE